MSIWTRAIDNVLEEFQSAIEDNEDKAQALAKASGAVEDLLENYRQEGIDEAINE